MTGTAQFNSYANSSDYTLHTSTGSTINLSSVYDAQLGANVYTGTIQIAANQTSVIIELRSVNDALREGSEEAILELIPNGSPSYEIGTSQATIVIADNDNWYVNATAVTSSGAETSGTAEPVIFRVTRTGETDLSKALTVYYRLSGTALYSTDYTLTGGSYSTSSDYGSLTIAANQSYADLQVNIVNDNLWESTETVTLVLIDPPNNTVSAYRLGADPIVSGTIADNDQWTLAVAATQNGAETNQTAVSAQFTVIRSGEEDLSKALTVYYRLSGTAVYGTDYTLSGGSYNTSYDFGSITIAANQSTATITFAITNDALAEETETIQLALLDALPANYSTTSVPQYTLGESAAASATIADNDNWQVNITATTALGAERLSGQTAQPILFTISRTGEADLSKSLMVYYQREGSATVGADYNISGGGSNGSFGYVTIAANAFSAVLTLNILDDDELETRENVVITLRTTRPEVFSSEYFSDAQYTLGEQVSATGLIDDNENAQMVNIAAVNATASETNDGQTASPALFRITRTGGSNAQALNVFYTLGGTAVAGSDYSAPTAGVGGARFVTIAAGADSVDLSLSILNDAAAESAETLVVSLVPVSSYYQEEMNWPAYLLDENSTASVTIQDNDTPMTIEIAGDLSVCEGGTTTLTAQKGFDPLGTGAWTFVWDLDGDGVFGETGSSAEEGEESGATILLAAGTRAVNQTITVQVQATDGVQTVTQSVTLTVINVAPVVAFDGRISGNVMETLTWSGSFVDPGNNSWTASVDFFDGDGPTAVTLGADKTFSLSHSFADAGWHTMELTLSDGIDAVTVRREILVATYPAGGIGTATLTLVLEDENYSAHLSGQPITLQSDRTDANGSRLNPQPGEEVAVSFWLVNQGTESVSLDWEQAIWPTGVKWLVQPETSQIAPSEAVWGTIVWDALAPLSGTGVIPNLDPNEPNFTLQLGGTVAALTDPPALTSFGLLYDSGDNTTDLITYNPQVTGVVEGNFGGGSVVVQFDHDNDGVAEGFQEVTFDGMSFTYDPRTTDADWPDVVSGSESVSLRYRLLHYQSDGETLFSTGAWTAFGYTLVPTPTNNFIVSNLAISEGFGGTWPENDAAKLTGTVSGSGTRHVEVRIGNETLWADVNANNTFTVYLPGQTLGTAVTITARSFAPDTTAKMELPGAWASMSVTPSLPSVSSLTLVTDDGASSTDGVSSVLTLTGSLAAGVGRAYCEVEFTCGDTVLGSAWTDAFGVFTFTPKALPITNGIASGTITARAVYRPVSGNPIYGISASKAIEYAPAALTSFLNITLAQPLSAQGTTTSNPMLQVTGSFAAEKIVHFEYQWQTANGAWSQAKRVAAFTADGQEETAASLLREATFRLPGLFALPSGSSTVTVRVRAVVYDEMLNEDRIGSDWTTRSFIKR